MKIRSASTTLDSELHIPAVFKEFLKQRGIEGDEHLGRFLFPRLAHLPKPAKMANLPKAAQLTAKYLLSGKPIVIWGDYDVDGTTGTALLVNFLREFEIAASWHIPSRILEGYGLNYQWFQENQKNILGKDFLLITVDCGISNHKEIEQIQKIGGNVIVTDHHSIPKNGLPQCLVLNPSMPSCDFHEEQLAGVGVAFYLAAGIRAELLAWPQFKEIAKTINLKKYLAFVALGTIADVVELTNVNRILVRAGLEALSETTFPGLTELLASCDIENGFIASEDIAYLVGPKINAAGRLGESELVVNLLTETDKKQAKKLAADLTELNLERKRISANNLETTLTMISHSRVTQEKCVIVKGQFHQGVVGIVASRIVEIFGYPALVFAEKIESDKSMSYFGSARSVEGINIIEIITGCSMFIERFGGHAMAAGLVVAAENFKKFSDNFSALIKEKWQNHQVKKRKPYDIDCSVEKLMSQEYLDFMKLLEPFGPGNSQPIFRDRQAEIVDSRAIGKASEHLHLTIRGKFANLKGVGFNLGAKVREIQDNPQRTIIYSTTINRFRGNVSWQVRVLEI